MIFIGDIEDLVCRYVCAIQVNRYPRHSTVGKKVKSGSHDRQDNDVGVKECWFRACIVAFGLVMRYPNQPINDMAIKAYIP